MAENSSAGFDVRSTVFTLARETIAAGAPGLTAASHDALARSIATKVAGTLGELARDDTSLVPPGGAAHHAHALELAARRLQTDGRPASACSCLRAAAFLRALIDPQSGDLAQRDGGARG